MAGDRFVVGAVPGRRTLLTAILVGAFLTSLATLDRTGDLVHSGGGSALLALLQSLLRPDLDPLFLARAARACLLTLAYAVTATTVAILLGLPSALLASGVLVRFVPCGWPRPVSPGRSSRCFGPSTRSSGRCYSSRPLGCRR